MNRAEVVIVGAGPAGSSLGLRLARAGYDVLILDRSRFPREKPCGDCVNPGAVSELRALGLERRMHDVLRPRHLRGWRIEAPDGRFFEAWFGPVGTAVQPSGWAVRRREFDRALLDEARRAGARVRERFRVFDLLRGDGRVIGVVGRDGIRTEQVRGRWVVGADGLRSVVRRRLGLGAPPRNRKLALVAHFTARDIGGRVGELRVREGVCCGYAPLGEGANVTLVVPQGEARPISRDPVGYFASRLSLFPEVADRMSRGAVDSAPMITGPFDAPVRRPWSPGALLVGDAAGYYDPFTGQGICQALRGARLASRAVSAALAAEDAEPRLLRTYGRRLRRELAPTRALQRAIQAVVGRPRVMSWFVERLSRVDGRAAQRLLRVTGDLEPALTLLAPSLWWPILMERNGDRR